VEVDEEYVETKLSKVFKKNNLRRYL